MAISPLNIQQIVAVIRQQIAAPVATAADMTPTAAPRTKTKASSGAHSRRRPKHGGLSKLIVHRVGVLQKDDPERGRKAFRIFLESVLINELGENLINDPGFYQMVSDIQVQMENNPDIEKVMREAIERLLAGIDPIIDAKD
jgi:hypothetical protein